MEKDFKSILKNIVAAPLDNEFKDEVLNMVAKTFDERGNHNYEFEFCFSDYFKIKLNEYYPCEDIKWAKENLKNSYLYRIYVPRRYERHMEEINKFMVDKGFNVRKSFSHAFNDTKYNYYSISL